MSFEDKLAKLVDRHRDLAAQMASQGPRDAQDYARLSREYSELSPVVESIAELQKARREIRVE